MNKYKVTNLPFGYKEKKVCVTCNKKINGKKTLNAYYIEQLNNYWEDPDRWTNVACSEICADTYILAHMDMDCQTPFDKFIFPIVRSVWPNLISEDAEDFEKMKERLKNGSI